MSGEVERFDPSKLTEGIKDRIKATFVALIPDEQWEKMINEEIGNYFKAKDRGGYTRDNISDFGLLVRQMLSEDAKARLAKHLSSHEYQITWGENGVPIISKAIEELIINNSGKLLMNLYGEVFSNMLQNFMYQLQNKPY